MHHIVIDLEMNNINKKYKEQRKIASREVIEIGAVMADEHFDTIDTFNMYVKPEFNTITEEVNRLTGITDAKLLFAKHFNEVMTKFVQWIGEEEIIMYSWSSTDYAQIKKECALKNFDNDVITRAFESWVDLQKEFGNRLNVEKPISLRHAINALGSPFEGSQHSALDDALNTLHILRLCRNEGEFERIMKIMLDAFKPQEPLTYKIGDLLNGLKVQLE